MWLYATFKVSLPDAILVEGEPGETVSVGVNLGAYDAEVQLSLNPLPGRVKKGNDGGWHYLVNEVEVTVLRHTSLPDGSDSREDVFKNELLPEYQLAAVQASNRLAVFLKHRLWRSLFSAMERFTADVADLGSSGGQEHGDTCFDIQVRPMADGHVDFLQRYINENYSHELGQAFLDLAQQSIVGKCVRRACLELTMACESFVQQRIGAAQQLPEAIDDRFKSRHQAAYIDLNGLFQARDEAAKKRDGFFSISSQAKRQMSHENLMVWGASVTCLKQWLHQDG